MELKPQNTNYYIPLLTGPSSSPNLIWEKGCVDRLASDAKDRSQPKRKNGAIYAEAGSNFHNSVLANQRLVDCVHKYGPGTASNDEDHSEVQCSSVAALASVCAPELYCLLEGGRFPTKGREPSKVKVALDLGDSVGFHRSISSFFGCRNRKLQSLDKGCFGTIGELNELSTGDEYDIILGDGGGNRMQLKSDSKSRLIRTPNLQCKALKRVKSHPNNISLPCRPCKGIAGVKAGYEEAGLNALQDRCVQTPMGMIKPKQNVKCIAMSCQSNDQCYQMPLSCDSRDGEIQSQTSKASIGCCLSFPLPWNCSAAATSNAVATSRWQRKVSKREWVCCNDDGNDDGEKSTKSGESKCEVDVEVNSDSIDDSDTSTISLNMLQYGWKAAGSGNYTR